VILDFGIGAEQVPESCPKLLESCNTEDFNQDLVALEGLTQPSPSSCAPRPAPFGGLQH